MTVRELDVWYYGNGGSSIPEAPRESSATTWLAWEDVPSEMREKLQVGDRLVITNQDGETHTADIVDLEPCRIVGIYLEDV